MNSSSVLDDATSFLIGATDYYVRLPLECRCFNPSIIRIHDRLIYAWRACMRGGSICIGELHDDWTTVRDAQCLELPGRAEDPRLFLFRGDLWVAFTSPERPGKSSLGIARLTHDFRVAEFRRMESPFAAPVEKNWQFFEYDNELLCIYSIKPHIVGRVHGTKLQIVSSTPKAFDWPHGLPRGGTPPIRIGNEYFSFFHSNKLVGGRRRYVGGLYTFRAEPPFHPTRYYSETVLKAGLDDREACGPLVVYPGGAVLHEGQWLVAYGWHDAHCKLLAIPCCEISEMNLITERK